MAGLFSFLFSLPRPSVSTQGRWGISLGWVCGGLQDTHGGDRGTASWKSQVGPLKALPPEWLPLARAPRPLLVEARLWGVWMTMVRITGFMPCGLNSGPSQPRNGGLERCELACWFSYSANTSEALTVCFGISVCVWGGVLIQPWSLCWPAPGLGEPPLGQSSKSRASAFSFLRTHPAPIPGSWEPEVVSA